MQENEPGKNDMRSQWDPGMNSWSRLRLTTGFGWLAQRRWREERMGEEERRKKRARAYIQGKSANLVGALYRLHDSNLIGTLIQLWVGVRGGDKGTNSNGALVRHQGANRPPHTEATRRCGGV
jgi:hypothetical protein